MSNGYSVQQISTSNTSDIAIQATDETTETEDEECRDEYDFEYPFLFSDVVLIVQDRRLHCHRAILSIYSPVFKAMFQGKFEENSHNQVKMPKDDPEVVLELLRHLYTPGGRDMDSAAAQRLLPLIHRYQIESLLSTAERSLTFSLTDSLAPKLLIVADLYNLNNLKETAMEACSRLELSRICKGFEESSISPEIKAAVFKKRIEILEKCVVDIQNSFTHSCIRMENKLERIPTNHCQDHAQPLSTRTVRINVHGTTESTSPNAVGEVDGEVRPTLIQHHTSGQILNQSTGATNPSRLTMRIVQSSLNDSTPAGAGVQTGEAISETGAAVPETSPLTYAEMPVVCESCVERISMHITDLCKRALHKATFIPFKSTSN